MLLPAPNEFDEIIGYGCRVLLTKYALKIEFERVNSKFLVGFFELDGTLIVKKESAMCYGAFLDCMHEFLSLQGESPAILNEIRNAIDTLAKEPFNE